MTCNIITDVAALAISFSSVSVIANALRLRSATIRLDMRLEILDLRFKNKLII